MIKRYFVPMILFSVYVGCRLYTMCTLLYKVYRRCGVNILIKIEMIIETKAQRSSKE